MRSALALVITLASASAATAGATHSPSACAVAWNRSASPRMHAMLGKSHARAAFIDSRVTVGRDTWSKAGGTTSTSSLGCGIQVVLPRNDVLFLWGRWQGATIRGWQAHVANRHLPGVPHNARVHRDGTIGFTG